MTNQMLTFGGNHNGINCIQKTDAERPCDKIWFTEAQICEWSAMGHSTMYRRLKLLEEKGRISRGLYLDKVDVPTATGAVKTTIYNLNVLNQLAMVCIESDTLNEMAKKFSGTLSEVETTGSYGTSQISRKDQLYLAVIHADSDAVRTDALKELDKLHEQEVKAIECQRDEAIRTKAYISDKKTATALGKVGGLVKENNHLKETLGIAGNYRTILAVANKNHLTNQKYISWRKLKAYCTLNNLEIKETPDERYGSVKAYPVEAFKAVYPELVI